MLRIRRILAVSLILLTWASFSFNQTSSSSNVFVGADEPPVDETTTHHVGNTPKTSSPLDKNATADSNGTGRSSPVTKGPETEKKSRSQLPLFQQREVACFDRSPHCPQWSRSAECRKKNGRLYMRDNCPYSCNLCNPLLQAWTPRDTHPYSTVTYESQEKMGITIHTGVEQKTDFSDSPMRKYTLAESSTPAMKSTIRTEDEELTSYLYTSRRIQDILLSQANYIDDFYGDLDYGSGVRTSIDTDYDDIPDAIEMPLVETCLNRHPYCANWASRGMCESRPEAMEETCAPVCHFCRANGMHDKKLMVSEPNEDLIRTPFGRSDLFGILEAMQDDRVSVEWVIGNKERNDQVRKANLTFFKSVVGEEVIFLMDTRDMIKTMYIWNRSLHHSAYLRKILKISDSDGDGENNSSTSPTGKDETGIVQQNVMVVQNFTSQEACHGILDAIRFGVGLDATSAKAKRGEDGFPVSSKEGRLQPTENADDFFLARKSSQIMLFPTLYDSRKQKQFAPSVEKVLAKVSLMIGIPMEQLEVPIKVEKFEAGEFRREVSHFRDAIQIVESEKYLESSVKPGEEYRDTHLMDRTATMENARVFGVTLFLSDANGGHVYFPNMSNSIRVDPKIGGAIFFPTVISLNGNWDTERVHLDKDYANTGDDGQSFLVEDMTTIFGHAEVTSGTKYCMTFYFRRFPREDPDHNKVTTFE